MIDYPIENPITSLRPSNNFLLPKYTKPFINFEMIRFFLFDFENHYIPPHLPSACVDRGYCRSPYADEIRGRKNLARNVVGADSDCPSRRTWRDSSSQFSEVRPPNLCHWNNQYIDIIDGGRGQAFFHKNVSDPRRTLCCDGIVNLGTKCRSLDSWTPEGDRTPAVQHWSKKLRVLILILTLRPSSVDTNLFTLELTYPSLTSINTSLEYFRGANYLSNRVQYNIA